VTCQPDCCHATGDVLKPVEHHGSRTARRVRPLPSVVPYPTGSGNGRSPYNETGVAIRPSNPSVCPDMKLARRRAETPRPSHVVRRSQSSVRDVAQNHVAVGVVVASARRLGCDEARTDRVGASFPQLATVEAVRERIPPAATEYAGVLVIGVRAMIDDMLTNAPPIPERVWDVRVWWLHESAEPRPAAPRPSPPCPSRRYACHGLGTGGTRHCCERR
jgi:hypothetical protein